MAVIGSSKDTFYKASHLVAKLPGGAGMINAGLSHPSQCIAVWQIHTHSKRRRRRYRKTREDRRKDEARRRREKEEGEEDRRTWMD